MGAWATLTSACHAGLPANMVDMDVVWLVDSILEHCPVGAVHDVCLLYPSDVPL